MRISYNWLKDYIKTNLPPDEISKILTNTGLEVESLEKIESIKGGLEGVVVGEIKSIEDHPNADRLKITHVNVGDKDKNLQIVCGANNIAVGQKVVVALEGAIIYPTPDEPLKIKRSKIRGIESSGMICAEDELGLGNSHDGILILDENAKIGLSGREQFKLEDDYLFEIGLTPNRSDAMGHIGVARDIKAYLNFHENESLSIKLPSKFEGTPAGNGGVKIKIHDLERCPRYMGAIVKGVQVQESPEWLKNRLRIIGLNPINNLVDITNYILHETGNPLHAFDLAKVGAELNVRTAQPGEKIITLDEQERELDENDLVICNDQVPMCIAGTLGGLDAGVSDQTQSILLEAAYFNPVSVRKTAKRHTINTDSSFRFERGVDPNNVEFALRRALQLIVDLAGGEVIEIQDHYPALIEKNLVKFDFDRCRQLIGTEISDDEISKILEELEIEADLKLKGFGELSIPTYRVDVTREADVIEEVLRIYGFNQVPIPEKLNASISYRSKINPGSIKNIVANQLVSNGLTEIMNNSLSAANSFLHQNDSELVEILNPLSNELNVMRKNILEGGLQTIAYNQNRQDPNQKLFEFGKIYAKSKGQYIETEKLGIWLTGSRNQENWTNQGEDVDFYDLKNIVYNLLHRLGIQKFQESQEIPDSLAYGLELTAGKKSIGFLGAVNAKLLKHYDVKKSVFFAAINWNVVLSLVEDVAFKSKSIPKTQFIRRDFSLLIDSTAEFAAIRKIAYSVDSRLLKKVGLFDVYEGKNLPDGKKSYAVSFIFQDENKTLKDKQIDAVMDGIRNKLEEELKAELR